MVLVKHHLSIIIREIIQFAFWQYPCMFGMLKICWKIMPRCFYLKTFLSSGVSPQANQRLAMEVKNLVGKESSNLQGRADSTEDNTGVHYLLAVQLGFNGALSWAATMTSASEQKPLTQFNQGNLLTVTLLGDTIVNSEIKHGGGKGSVSAGTSNNLNRQWWETISSEQHWLTEIKIRL